MVFRIKLLRNDTLTFVANIYILTFHVAFKTRIRGENCICSGAAVFYKAEIQKMYSKFLFLK